MIPVQFQVDTDADGPIFGAGSNYCYVDGTVSNPLEIFDIAEPKSQDVTLNGVDGVFPNPDYRNITQQHIAVEFKNAPDLETLMFSGLGVLYNAWLPRVENIQVAWCVIDGTTSVCSGRPRGMTVDMSKAMRGVIRALLRFDLPAGWNPFD